MKPYVLCHMVCSVDGRIWGSRWRPKANIVPNLFERLHDQMGGGSWLCGRVTAQEFAKGTEPHYPPTDQVLPRENWFAQREARAWGIFLDGHGKAVWARRDIGGDPILVILTEAVPDRHLAGLRAGLIDELSLVICPVIDGSTGGPIVFNSGDTDLGPAPIESMTLVSHDVLEGGTMWLRYKLRSTAAEVN